jgi:hypothetical protein
MTMNDRLDAWLKTLDWPNVGPRLIAALEEIDFALHSAKRPAFEARKIVERVWLETGRKAAEREPAE